MPPDGSPWQAPAERLAALRLLVGVYAVGYLIGRSGALIGVADQASTQFRPVGPIAWLAHPLPVPLVAVAVVVAIMLGFGFCAGWHYRWTAPAFAIAFTWVLSYRNSWGMIFHTENLLALHVIVLALAASADAWSLDARAGRVGILPPAGRRYGWAIQLVSAVTVSTYLLAGIAKLRHAGLGWATNQALAQFIAYDNLRKAELGALHSPLAPLLLPHDWLLTPLAFVALAIELGAPLALLHPSIGRMWAIAAWCFHVGVLLTMFILFHYSILGFAYASFFPVERAVRAARSTRLQRMSRGLERRCCVRWHGARPKSPDRV